MKKLIQWQSFSNGLWKENPVLALMLGLCPLLAISSSVTDSLGMGAAFTFVLLGS
ncbi:MAG TPA: Rnf-Nqr domain containing protein, partial [bacterium]|nr:Rnf-Nqr domain containing protein [bacterium]